MVRRKRAIAVGAVVVAIMSVVSGSTPALADPYTNNLCQTNPAYHSMHENECELGSGSATPPQYRNAGGNGGGLGGLLRTVGGLLGLG